MEQPKKIELYVKRPFGEKVNASFDFLKENWKPMFKFITYLLLPLSLVQAVAMDKLFSVSLDLSMLQEQGGDPLTVMNAGFLLNYVLLLICAVVGSSLLGSLVYAMIQVYGTRENRLAGVTLAELRPLMMRNFKRCILLFLFMILVMLVYALVLVPLVMLSLWTLLLIIPLTFICFVPLALFTPVYLFEKISIWKAFLKSFRLGFPTWGGILLMAFVMGLISSAAQIVVVLPYEIAVIVKYFFTLSDMSNEATASAGYNVFLYLLSVVMTFGTYLAGVFTLLGLAYQYGHASELADNVSITNDIENFDTL